MTNSKDDPSPDLRTFAILGCELSLSMAAQQFGVTTNAVSQSLRQFERQLRVKFIRRSGNRIMLTRTAERALPDIDRGFLALGWRARSADTSGKDEPFHDVRRSFFRGRLVGAPLSIIRGPRAAWRSVWSAHHTRFAGWRRGRSCHHWSTAGAPAFL